MIPQSPNGRKHDDQFLPHEELYRAVASQDLYPDGNLISFRCIEGDFPGVSVNRQKYSAPADVLHPNCCGSASREGWGVMVSSVDSIVVLRATTAENKAELRRTFNARVFHTPLGTCYAHSEIDCTLVDEPDRTKPSPIVKRELRAAIARSFRIVIKPAK